MPKKTAAKKTARKLGAVPATVEPRAVLAKGTKVFCMHSELQDVDALVPNPRNPNTHPPEQLKLLAKVIRAQGWRQPIVVSTRSGFVVKGHGRLAAARLMHAEHGDEKVPVEHQDYATEADEWADMMADNRIAELSTLDFQGISGLLLDLQGVDGFDLDLTGFFDYEREPLLQAVWNPPAPQNDMGGHEHGRKYSVTEAQGKIIDKALVLAKQKHSKVGKGGAMQDVEDAEALVLIAQDYMKRHKGE